jgi:hypothetical protein
MVSTEFPREFPTEFPMFPCNQSIDTEGVSEHTELALARRAPWIKGNKWQPMAAMFGKCIF